MGGIITTLGELLDTNRKNRYKLTPYLLEDGKAHKVAIICPGGAYRRICNFIEGYPYAKKLNRMGYHAFVVYYRVKDQARFPNPQDDLARAVGEVLAHSEQWKLDMDDYSVWGSSAGGHLAAGFGTASIGYAKYGLPKPGAVILTYPVVTMGEKGHPGTRSRLLGEAPTQELIELTSIERQITPDYPPTFVWWGDSDKTLDPEHSRMLEKTLKATSVPCRCREYKGVGHGMGIGWGFPCAGWFEDAVRFWESQWKTK